jgi:hypothetical protein
MKKLFLSFFLLLWLHPTFAQFSLAEEGPVEKVVFPVFPKYSDKNLTILPTWTPGKKFLKDNPNFLKDGSYKLNSGMVRKTEPYMMDAYPFYSTRFININSGSFPATFAESGKKLDFLDKVHFTFTMSPEANIKLPLSRKWMLVDEITAEVDGLQSLVKRYDEAFSRSVQQLVIKKVIPQHEITPIPSSLYGENGMSVNELVFDFQCLGVWSYTKNDKSLFWGLVPPAFAFIPVTPNFWMFWMVKHSGGDYFPSTALFQLNVKDVTGNLIKSYRQAIFIGEKHKYFKSNSIYTVNRDLMLQSMPMAMESLVNRYLLDEPMLTATQNHLKNLALKSQANPNLLELAKAQAKVNMLYRRKTSMLWRIGMNKDNIAQMGTVAQQIPQAMSNQQQLSNAIYTDPRQQQLNSLGLSAGAAIGNMLLSNSINRNAREASRIAELYRATEEAESQYVAQIAELMESDTELAAMVSKSKSVNQFFQDELKRVAQVKEASKQQTAALKEVVKETFSKTLTDFAARNNIDLAQMSAIASGETPPASSTGSSNSAAKSGSTAKSGKTATDACARQYEAAWRNSAEYKKWKSTGNYADQCMAEWKQGMLILQYCGSVLPPAEKAAIQKVAEQCRQRASQVKSANTGGIRF